jgi:outer membrane protein TolC
LIKLIYYKWIGNGVKMFPKTVLIFLVLFFCLYLAEAKGEELLTWDDCVREAKKNHPDLISAQERLNQAKSNKAISMSNILPQVTSDLTQTTSKTAGNEKADTYSYSVSARQLVFDGLKNFYDIRAAAENVKSSEHDYETTSAEVRLRLRTAFIQILRAQELSYITEDIASRRKQNLELVKLRYEAGREHKGSLLTAQANLAEAEFEVAQARRNIRLAQRQLIKELGRIEYATIRVEGDFDVKSTFAEAPDFEELAQSSPVLKELIAQTRQARFDLKSARAEFFPEVYANASSGRTASDWPPQQDRWSAGVILSFPIFEGGSRIAKVSGAKAAFNQSQADQRSGRDTVVLALELAWLDLQDSIGKLEVEGRFLEATQERAKITQAQYSTGLISFDNWTIIEDDSVRAKKSFLEARVNALLAEANWLKAQGRTLDED